MVIIQVVVEALRVTLHYLLKPILLLLAQEEQPAQQEVRGIMMVTQGQMEQTRYLEL